MTVTAIGLRVGLALGATACVTTAVVPPPTTVAVASAPIAPIAPMRAGTVESVKQVRGATTKSVGDALVSMLVISVVLGAVVFDTQGPDRFGLAAGVAATDTDSGSTELPEYDVVVRFDDGGSRTFVFDESAPPFREGDRVVLSANDLRAASD